MVRAYEHWASKQLHQIFARMTNQPTSSLWWWRCGDERTEMRTPDCGKQRRSSEAFHGRTVHDHCGAWLMPQRRCYGCDRRWDRRLSLCQSWGCITKGNSFFAAASAGLDLCDQSQSSPVFTWDNTEPTLHKLISLSLTMWLNVTLGRDLLSLNRR